jgi:hypothetical protein
MLFAAQSVSAKSTSIPKNKREQDLCEWMRTIESGEDVRFSLMAYLSILRHLSPEAQYPLREGEPFELPAEDTSKQTTAPDTHAETGISEASRLIQDRVWTGESQAQGYGKPEIVHLDYRTAPYPPQSLYT